MRREAIVRTTGQMLAEMPASDVTLNELSRRAGLAKSNVLRYFESREAILLELLIRGWQEWRDALSADLATGIDPSTPIDRRREDVAHLVAASLARRPVLCDLASAQASVLERHVGVESVRRYRRATAANCVDVATILTWHLPELDMRAALEVVSATLLMAPALWSASHPSPTVVAACAAEPEIAQPQPDFESTLGELGAVVIAGVLARRRSRRPGS